MCPVQWRAPQRFPSPLTFLRVPPRQAVCILEEPDRMQCLALHWQEEARTSVPCMGDDCLLCPESVKKFHVYTVVLSWNSTGKMWVKAILDCGAPGGRLVTDNFVGEKIVIDRERDKTKAGFIAYCGPVTNPIVTDPPKMEPVDVRPYLMRRYGLFDEADYFAALPYMEQGRLKFPSKEDEKAS